MTTHVLTNDLCNLPHHDGQVVLDVRGAHSRRLGHEEEAFAADALIGTIARRRGERVRSEELAKELGMDQRYSYSRIQVKVVKISRWREPPRGNFVLSHGPAHA